MNRNDQQIRLRLVGGAILVLVLGTWVWSSWTAARATAHPLPPPSESAARFVDAADGEPAIALAATQTERSRAGVRPGEGVLTCTVHVSSGTSGVPVEGALIRRVGRSRVRRGDSAVTLGTTDAGGWCVVPIPGDSSADQHRLEVSARGFVTREVAVPTHAETTNVELERGCAVRVLVVDDRGAPLPSVLVAVGSGEGPIPLRDLVSFDEHSALAPADFVVGGDAPLQFVVTDEAGVAAFEGFAPGDYSVQGFKRGWWCVEQPGDSDRGTGGWTSRRSLLEGQHEWRLTMRRIHIAALAATPECGVVCTSGALSGVDATVGAVSQALEAHVRSLHPDVVWLSLGTSTSGEPPPAEVQVFSRWSGWFVQKVDFQPFDELQPVVLAAPQVRAAAPRSARVGLRIVDRSSNVFVPRGWIAAEQRGRWSVVAGAGTETELPPGVYQIALPLLAWAKQLRAGVAVDAGDLRIIELAAPHELVMLRIRIVAHDGAAFPNCTLRVAHRGVSGRLVGCIANATEHEVLVPLPDDPGGAVVVSCASAQLRGSTVIEAAAIRGRSHVEPFEVVVVLRP